ncbi:MAG: TSUP family transporter [Gammaproteobacteria bacterium]|nr:TSUP family transporter [Gammaproteobacteria bacterium]
MILDFSTTQLLVTGLVFIWAGFVRSGLGFGGAALGLPLMLFVHDDPLLWLPIIGSHLLFFTSLTLRSRLGNVDWAYLRRAALYIVPPAIVGVFGLVTLPTRWLNLFIYSVTLFYGGMWALNIAIRSQRAWMDKALLVAGGYVAGTSLTGAPLMVAVFMRNVSREQLRNTLFVLWFILVAIKMSTFVALSVPLHLVDALFLLPLAAVGHVIGLRAHDAILNNDAGFRRWIGGGLVAVSLAGLWRVSGGG